MPDAVLVLSAAAPVRGMERAALDVAAVLRAAGLDVEERVLTPDPPAHLRGSRLARAAAFAASFAAARRLVRAPGPPLVLVGIWVGLRVLPWRRRGDRAVVAWEHSLTPQRRAALRSFDVVARLVLPLYARRARTVVAVSPAVAQALGERPALAARTVVIPNPVSPRSAPRRAGERDVGAGGGDGSGDGRGDGGGAQLLYAGGLERLKNPALALRALALLPGAHLHVAGSGRTEPALRALAERLGVAGAVTWHGFTDRVPQLMADADALVHPSLSETFGYALLEAAAAHLPVVAVATPQAQHLVPRLVPGATCAPEPAALAQAVRAVLADPPGTAAWAAADAARARAFDPAALVAAWREVLAVSPR